jgi:hypothetical protein
MIKHEIITKVNMNSTELMECFGWFPFACECGEMFKLPCEHGFGFSGNETVVPSAIFTFDCPTCKKTYNIKIEVWKA